MKDDNKKDVTALENKALKIADKIARDNESINKAVEGGELKIVKHAMDFGALKIDASTDFICRAFPNLTSEGSINVRKSQFNLFSDMTKALGTDVVTDLVGFATETRVLRSIWDSVLVVLRHAKKAKKANKLVVGKITAEEVEAVRAQAIKATLNPEPREPKQPSAPKAEAVTTFSADSLKGADYAQMLLHLQAVENALKAVSKTEANSVYLSDAIDNIDEVISNVQRMIEA